MLQGAGTRHACRTMQRLPASASRLTSLDIRRSNFSDVMLLARLRELRLLVMGEADGPISLAPLAVKGSPSTITVLRDDAGYLGCSFKHSNLKHMCDRHAQRANSIAGANAIIGAVAAAEETDFP